MTGCTTGLEEKLWWLLILKRKMSIFCILHFACKLFWIFIDVHLGYNFYFCLSAWKDNLDPYQYNVSTWVILVVISLSATLWEYLHQAHNYFIFTPTLLSDVLTTHYITKWDIFTTRFWICSHRLSWLLYYSGRHF